MYIGRVVIQNFRAFHQLHFDLSAGVNVIVGPNAIGKTTILQAIRLTKAILAPRSPKEGLISGFPMAQIRPLARRRGETAPTDTEFLPLPSSSAATG